DLIGKQTLDVISEADKFNRWMYETIQPYTKGRILEIGSGIGNISRFFLKDKAEITLSDYSTQYFEILKSNIKSFKNCNGVVKLDLVHPNFKNEYSDLQN